MSDPTEPTTIFVKEIHDSLWEAWNRMTAENERLRTIDDAMVERALDSWMDDWRHEHPEVAEVLKRHMRAALEAALGPRA